MEVVGSGFDKIPEGCIAHVIGLTCSRDACRSAAVSSAFRSASESDTVWDRFLPADLGTILDRAVDPVVEVSSKKELFFRLCDPILIDGGKMSFALEKSSGAKCYMMSARELNIVWGDNPTYWIWLSAETERNAGSLHFNIELPTSAMSRRLGDPNSYSRDGALGLSSRFSEVAYLIIVCWLEIRGKIDSRMLSPKVTYGAYLIYKLVEDGTGFENVAVKASVKVGAYESKSTVYLQPASSGPSRGFQRSRRRRPLSGVLYPSRVIETERTTREGEVPSLRADGWMEIEIGKFFIDESEDGEVEMCIMEVELGHGKSGLAIQGIEVRPCSHL